MILIEAYVSREPADRFPGAILDVPFLITASELRDRKTKRRRKRDDPPGRAEVIRRLVEIGLRAKPK
jgi:hypothetical protein